MESTKLEKTLKENYNPKRKFVEIEKGVARKMDLFCFLKDIHKKYFVTKAVERELKPYENWLESVRKLKSSYV